MNINILYCRRGHRRRRHRQCDRIISHHRRHQSSSNRRTRTRTRYNNNHCCGISLQLLLIIILIISLSSSPSLHCGLFVEAATKTKTETNLYKILGVSSRATINEIKKAYRMKALDTHPDKNKDVPKELAADQFQKVVHAFEVLSDVSSRNQYDRTGNAGSATDTGSGGNGGNSGGAGTNGFGSSGTNGFHWQFKWNTGSGGQSRQRYQRPKLKDRFDVKEAQSRLLHIVSLEQLETIITDDDGVLERNLLLCFYTPPFEDHVMNDMVYPWPFAAKSTQGIWWEDLLQTTVVRYHRSNSITDFFHIPFGDKLTDPIFIFGKRGTKFSELGGGGGGDNRLQTDERDVFDQWVWTNLQVPVTFLNNHNSPIELYWIHDNTAKLKNIIQVGESITLTTMLSHEWWVRDVNTDTRNDSPGRYKLHNNTCLYSITIISDIRTIYTIPLRHCYDKSGHCTFWNAVGGNQECQRNAIFMNEVCPLTCGVCIKDDDDDQDNETNDKKNGNDEL